MKKISLGMLMVILFCLTSTVQADHKSRKRSRRVRRPIIFNIGGINIEIGTKRNGRRGVRVDVPQGGVHVDIDSKNAKQGTGGVHVVQNGITYWGDGIFPTSPVAPPLPESNIELGAPTESGKPFDLDEPIEEKTKKQNQIIVPPAPKK